MSDELEEQVNNDNDDSEESVSDATPSSAPAAPRDADITNTAAYRGVIADLQSERQRRQELQAEIERIKAEKAESELFDDEDGDDLVTKSKLDKYLEMREKRLEDSRAKAEEERRTRALNESDVKARREMTAEVMGEGLDYASVMAAGMANLKKGDRQNIAEADDPAKEAYELCLLRTPELRKRAESHRNSKLLSKISEKSAKAGETFGGLGDMIGPSQVDKLAELPDSELYKMLEEMK